MNALINYISIIITKKTYEKYEKSYVRLRRYKPIHIMWKKSIRKLMNLIIIFT